MGDKICIRFVDKHCKSAVLYSHWRGKTLLQDVNDFMEELNERVPPDTEVYPLQRREPEIMMTNFVLWLHDKEVITLFTPTAWYLYPNFYCDTGDNGPWEIDSVTGEAIKFLEEEKDADK